MSQLPLLPIVLTLLLFAALIFVNWLIVKLFCSIAERKEIPEIRVSYIQKYFKGIVLVIAFLFVLSIWGVDYGSLLVFASSILALLGVALVAQWSILSNITAGMIIFFSFPAKIGDEIEIYDNNNLILRGKIIEINLFQLLIKDNEGHLLSYPNNLILQRPVRRLVKPKPVWQGETKHSRLQIRISERS